MEAMIVSPAPEPNAFKHKSGNQTQSGSESTFAPALDKAIQEKNSSDNRSTKNSNSKGATESRKKSEDDFKNSDLNNDSTAQSSVTQELSSKQNPDQTTSAKGHDIASAAQKAAEGIKDGRATGNAFQKGEGNIPARQAVSSTVLAMLKDSTQSNNALTQQEAASISQLLSKAAKDSNVAAQFNQATSGQTGEQLSVKQSHTNGNTIYLQGNDSITWNQSNSSSSKLPLQNSSLLQFTSGDPAADNGTAIRVERFDSNAAILSQNSGESSDSNLPLSAERIAAKLTDIPLQTNNSTPGLRDNTPSLRQEIHAQLIDAKLENIDKKQPSQTDDQLMNSESDSAQKNNLAGPVKYTDKPIDSSFAQAIQTMTSEKSSSGGVESMRHGGSVFAPQVHENHILHQVLHKFRIAQHLQDQKLVMKLHPAELGDLKIDIQLKNGTISTNILAQSQQVQDILEKNMPRLKALMEEQGLVVNEITVKLDTDVSDNNNLFEDHLAQDDKSFTQKRNSTTSSQFQLHQEDSEEVEFGAQPTPSSVNVMI